MKPDKRPAKKRGFAWGRITHEGGDVEYRMFRRDKRGAMHYEWHAFDRREPRGYVIRELRRMYKRLRDRVDEIDLAILDKETA